MNILNIYRLHEVMIMSDEYEQFIEGTTIVMEFEYSGEFYAAHIVKSRLPFNHLTVKLPAYDVFLLGRLFDKEARMISLPEHEANYLLQGLVTHPNARLRLKFI